MTKWTYYYKDNKIPVDVEIVKGTENPRKQVISVVTGKLNCDIGVPKVPLIGKWTIWKDGSELKLWDMVLFDKFSDQTELHAH